MNNRILLKIKHAKLRAARGRLRASDLARDLGLSPQTFATYENGSNRVPAPVLLKWCELLGVQPSSVIIDEDKKLLQALVTV